VARSAPAAPRQAPHIAAPSRPSPSIQRAQRQNAQRATTGAASNVQSAQQQQRLQQLQSRGHLSRGERREVQRLQREQRQNVKTDNAKTNKAKTSIAAQPNASSAQQSRLQQLQSQRHLSRNDRRELRQLQQQQQQTARPQQQLNQPNAQTAQQSRLQQLQSQRHLNRGERRELRQLQQQERQNARQQRLNAPAAATAANQQPRTPRTRALSQQQVTQGRFAMASANAGNRGPHFAARRAARLAARTAWQLGLFAPYVPWRGPVYWPYAYNDVFYYTFWPDAYDPGYWAYAYDDFFDGVFFPDGAPYAEYAAEGPYVATTTGSASARASAPGQVTRATREFCAEQAKGVTAWPFEKISEAVRPTAEQRTLLDNVKKAAGEAAEQLEQACPDRVPMTPPGRLQAMTMRLQATDDAIKIIKPPLETFYNSLNDEQKARFNEIGPQLGRQDKQRPANQAEQAQANCSGDKAGLSGLAANRIEDSLRPNEPQGQALDRLDEAMQKAVGILRDTCPNTIPMTPVGRLDVMQKRLEAMIEAANAVRPALDNFYASLSDEQKAKFNRLGRDANQSGG